MPKLEGGWPASTAMAFSAIARWSTSSSNWARTPSSWFSACTTSARAIMPASYWFCVSCSERV